MKQLRSRWKAGGLFAILFPREFYRRLAFESQVAQFTVSTAQHAEWATRSISNLTNQSDVIAVGGFIISKREGSA